MKKLYVMRFSEEERAQLHSLVHKGRAAAYRRRHDQALLRVDQGEHGPGEADRAVGDWSQHRGTDSPMVSAGGTGRRTGTAPTPPSSAPCHGGRSEATGDLLLRAARRLCLVVDIVSVGGCLEAAPRRGLGLPRDGAPRQVLKKRHKTLATADRVHSPETGCRIRVCDGTEAGRDHPSTGPHIRWSACMRPPSSFASGEPDRAVRRAMTPHTNATA